MKEIFRYKGKHILYNTGEVQASEDPAARQGADEAGDLTSEQMGIVLSSMSDNRIADSVKGLVEKASEGGSDDDLTEEQRRIVLGSMSDNRIADSVKDLVESSSGA